MQDLARVIQDLTRILIIFLAIILQDLVLNAGKVYAKNSLLIS